MNARACFVVFGIVLAAAAPAAAKGTSGGTVKIVSELPFPFDWFADGTGIPNAIRMALAETNGRVCGGKWTVAFEERYHSSPDAFWDPAAAAANGAADADPASGIVGIIGTYNSGAAMSMIPVVNPSHLVMISPSNTGDFLTKPGIDGDGNSLYPSGVRNYCRVIANNLVLGQQGARWMARLGARSVAIVDDGDGYGVPLGDAFAAEAGRIGLQVISRETINHGRNARTGAADQLASELATEHPDGVYFAGVNGGGELVSNLRHRGYGGIIMGADGILDQFLVDTSKGAFEGVYAAIPGLAPEALSGATAQWGARYTTLYGEPPSPYGVEAYVAAQVMLAAFDRVCASGGVPSDREAVRAAVLGTRDFDSVLGRFSFDADGDTTDQTVTGYRVRNNAWTLETVLR